MGREIRQVPEGWEHPKDESGRFVPMFDQTYAEAMVEWDRDRALWLKGEYPDQPLNEDGGQKTDEAFAGYCGRSPDPSSYRPAFATPPVCFQVYETVSEGTPKSPVFRTIEEIEAWLIKQGHSPEAAKAFARLGFAPSFASVGGKFVSGIDAMTLLDKPGEKS